MRESGGLGLTMVRIFAGIGTEAARRAHVTVEFRLVPALSLFSLSRLALSCPCISLRIGLYLYCPLVIVSFHSHLLLRVLQVACKWVRCACVRSTSRSLSSFCTQCGRSSHRNGLRKHDEISTIDWVTKRVSERRQIQATQEEWGGVRPSPTGR